MQTFLPYKDFERSAQVLDWRRLGKQRVETYQILQANLGIKDGWAHHPAALMWHGHEYQLTRYGLYMCREWKRRGYNPGVTQPRLLEIYKELKADDVSREMPWWVGKKKFHRAHRLKLVWKKPEHYLELFKDVDEVPVDEPLYWWPAPWNEDEHG